MTETVISIENLSKRYQLGVISTGTFYGDLTRWWAKQRGKPDPYLKIGEHDTRSRGGETIWALKDINLKVQHGQALGIIGRNGAGKSTLLKILSQVTVPTSGVVNIMGRISSLLEVGTGFHPELTGRENIFMNGAIMGMNRAEIARKIDEIVDFSGVEKFIDTPVKRYSSGMYVRLAFAVAAHLEPDILVVDEVLAVGDFEFQRKCLGKMQDFSGHGRTVLFVSHNLGSIQALCNRAILLDGGQIVMDDTAHNTVNHYLNMGLGQGGICTWEMSTAPGFEDGVKLRSIRVLDAQDTPRALFDIKEPVTVEVEYWVLKEKYSFNVHLYFSNETGQTILVSMNNHDSPYQNTPQQEGLYRERCIIPANLLNEGTIRVEYLICTRPTTQNYISVPNVVSFKITDDRSVDGVRGNWVRDWPPAMVRPLLKWEISRIGDDADAK